MGNCSPPPACKQPGAPRKETTPAVNRRGLPSQIVARGGPPEARRVTLGNFLFKIIGCLLLMPIVGNVEGWIEGLKLDPAREVVLFHFFFNVALALAFIFFTAPIARVAERLLPSRPASDDPSKPRQSLRIGPVGLAYALCDQAHPAWICDHNLMSKVCEQWSLEDLCEMDEKDMDALLGFYGPNKVPRLSDLHSTEPVYEFDGSFGWW